MVNLPALIPLPRVREVLGISRSQAYREAKAGRLRFVKIGSGTYIDGTSAQDFIASLPTARFTYAKERF